MFIAGNNNSIMSDHFPDAKQFVPVNRDDDYDDGDRYPVVQHHEDVYKRQAWKRGKPRRKLPCAK